MKKTILTLSLTFFSMILFLGFNIPTAKEKGNEVLKTEKFKIPDDIQPIIKKSCFGCHNTDSKNEKAKSKLAFDQLESLRKREIVGVLGKINEELKKGKMPPPKFLERFEKAKPTDEEVQKLLSWTNDAGEKMMKKKNKNKNKTKEKEGDEDKMNDNDSM